MIFKSLFRRKSISKILSDKHADAHTLHQTLSVVDLTSMGIAAIVGAGIFSTIGQAVVQGGVAISLLFVFTAFSCGLSALCYARFASSVPVSGSAYTYAYVSFGEIVAWMVGWSLVMEYAVSNVAVAISWSDYFRSLTAGFGLTIPTHFTIFGTSTAIDIPAFCITMIVTTVCYIGIKESRNTGNVLVLLKMMVIILVLAVGAFYVKPENWFPLAPHGISGVLYGISSVFFAYIGFDAISTMSEECKDPQKDMPKAMIWSLGISTLIYVAITIVLTGMVHFTELGVGDPLAFVFNKVGLNFLSGVVSLISVVTLSSVLLVYQLGQPRIWMTMSRDGLLPKIFSKMHPKFKTPSFSTVLMGVLVAIPALFADMKDVIDLTSMGTLFAFTLVCGGVIWQEINGEDTSPRFKIPYINARYFMPLIVVGAIYFISHNGIENLTLLRIVYFILLMFLAWQGIRKQLSFIPVLGVITNLFLMTELGNSNWIRFLSWLSLGLLVYAVYGYRKSKLRVKAV